MKRTLCVTLMVGGLLFVIFTTLHGRQQRFLDGEEARAADERQRTLAETPPPISVPGEQGGSGAASLNIPGQSDELSVPADLAAPAKRLTSPMASMGGMIQDSGSMAMMSSTYEPADATMNREAKQLAARVLAAQEPKKSKLRAELEKLTEKHFEYRQQRRAAEIAELADRVDKLRVAHHRRQENKPDILKRRLADLLDEENELKWDDVRVQPTLPAPGFSPFSSYTHIHVPQPKLPNLDGEWLVTLPAGFEFVGKIEKQPEGLWSFQDMRNLSGDYRLEGNTLKGITTDNKELRDYEWLILNDNVMVLTKAPQNIGSDYRGATLRRGAKPKTPIERSQSPAGADAQSGTAENLDPRQAAIRAAHCKAAEARLKFAKFQLDKALERIRKVPGAIPQTEIERLKTDVTVAEAELELALAGADLREERSRREPLSEPVVAAKLQQAEAALRTMKLEYDRVQKLVESKAVSQTEADQIAARLEEAKASVDVAKAELEEARRARPKEQ